MDCARLQPIVGKFARLRPVEAGDAEFLFALRSDVELTRFINDGPPDLAAQRRWMEAYFQRENDHCYLILSLPEQEPVGTVALYDIDLQGGAAESGRWLARKNPKAAIEANLLMDLHAFETLGLRRIYFTVCVENTKVVRYHTKFGARLTRTVTGYFQKHGQPMDSHFFELDRETFLAVKRPALEQLLYGAPNPARST